MTRKEEIDKLAKENYPEDAILRRAYILGAVQADQTMISKAVKWLNESTHCMYDFDGGWREVPILPEEENKLFETAMKE